MKAFFATLVRFSSSWTGTDIFYRAGFHNPISLNGGDII